MNRKDDINILFKQLELRNFGFDEPTPSFRHQIQGFITIAFAAVFSLAYL